MSGLSVTSPHCRMTSHTVTPSEVIATADPALTARMVDLIDMLVKALIGLGAFWAALMKIAKPYHEWRKDSLVKTIRASMAPEIQQLKGIIEKEETCAGTMETVLDKMGDVFSDHDLLMEIVRDNRERHDETSELLDTVFQLDRRIDSEKRARIDAMIAELGDRGKKRRRSLPVVLAQEVIKDADANQGE